MGFSSERHLHESELRFHSPGGAVCADCLDDGVLKQLIADEVSVARCDFCDREADHEIAADTDIVLEHISAALHVEYADPIEVLLWDGEDQQWAGAPVYDIGDLLEMLGELPLGHPRFEQFVLGAFGESQWCTRDPAWVSEGDALRYGWDDFRNTVKHAQRFFFDRARDEEPDPGHPVPHGRELLDRLGDLIRAYDLVTDLPAGARLHRARLHRARERLTTAEALGAPPPRLAAQSRMSPAGIPMFYAAEDRETALAEAIDPIRTRVTAATIAEFRTTEQCRIVDLDRVPGTPSIFDMAADARAARERVGFLHGFRRDVSARIERDGRIHIDYVPTQIVCEYLRHVFRDSHGRPVQGLAWQSAQRSGGRNVVLFIGPNRCIDKGESTPGVDGILVELVDSDRRRLNASVRH